MLLLRGAYLLSPSHSRTHAHLARALAGPTHLCVAGGQHGAAADARGPHQVHHQLFARRDSLHARRLVLLVGYGAAGARAPTLVSGSGAQDVIGGLDQSRLVFLLIQWRWCCCFFFAGDNTVRVWRTEQTERENDSAQLLADMTAEYNVMKARLAALQER